VGLQSYSLSPKCPPNRPGKPSGQAAGELGSPELSIMPRITRMREMGFIALQTHAKFAKFDAIHIHKTG
jgi:hypothetical protein